MPVVMLAAAPASRRVGAGGLYDERSRPRGFLLLLAVLVASRVCVVFVVADSVSMLLPLAHSYVPSRDTVLTGKFRAAPVVSAGVRFAHKQKAVGSGRAPMNEVNYCLLPSAYSSALPYLPWSGGAAGSSLVLLLLHACIKRIGSGLQVLALVVQKPPPNLHSKGRFHPSLPGI